MAIAVPSVSTNTMGTGGVLTKPTGLAVGDLLLAVVVAEVTANLAAPGSWTELAALTTPTYAKSKAFYKTADSGDVAASNFTFTGTDIRGGVLYRITGASITNNFVGTGTPIATDGLVIIWGIAGDNDGSNTSFSAYSVTGGASPTFTERLDSSENTGISTALGVADGVYSSTAAITAFSVTIGAGMDETNSQMIFINAVTSPTTDLSHITITPTVESLTVASVTVGVDVSHNAIVPTINGIDARATAPTQWQNEDKPTTTWINDPL